MILSMISYYEKRGQMVRTHLMPMIFDWGRLRQRNGCVSRFCPDLLHRQNQTIRYMEQSTVVLIRWRKHDWASNIVWPGVTSFGTLHGLDLRSRLEQVWPEVVMIAWGMLEVLTR